MSVEQRFKMGDMVTVRMRAEHAYALFDLHHRCLAIPEALTNFESSYGALSLGKASGAISPSSEAWLRACLDQQLAESEDG
jgi:hypothetical protein